MGKVWELLNGYKTYIGAFLYLLAKWLGPDAPEPDLLPQVAVDYVYLAAEAFGAVGLIHKVDKGVALLAKAAMTRRR